MGKLDKKNYLNSSLQQKPRSPLSSEYVEEEVTFKNQNDQVVLTGTLTLPKGKGPFPAVLLIAGAGPHARDAIKFGHKTFFVIADSLTRNGIAVLRYDKRGCGASTGIYETATTIDFLHDANAGIEYLRSRKEIKSHSIGLIGHSEGAAITAMLAATSPNIAFIILLGCPAVNGQELLLEQCTQLAQGNKESKEVIALGRKYLQEMCTIINTIKDNNQAKEHIQELHNAYTREITTLDSSPSQASIFDEAFGLAQILPWTRIFLSINPADDLQRIKIPLLAFFGERDLLVPLQQNLAPFKHAIQEAKNPDITVKLMPELNHRFQHCIIGTEEEYANIKETISSEVLTIMATWLATYTQN